MSGFEPDCPVSGRLVRLKISARTGHRYIHMYTDPDPQFLAPAQSLEIGQECPAFRRADLATLNPDQVTLR